MTEVGVRHPQGPCRRQRLAALEKAIRAPEEHAVSVDAGFDQARAQVPHRFAHRLERGRHGDQPVVARLDLRGREARSKIRTSSISPSKWPRAVAAAVRRATPRADQQVDGRRAERPVAVDGRRDERLAVDVDRDRPAVVHADELMPVPVREIRGLEIEPGPDRPGALQRDPPHRAAVRVEPEREAAAQDPQRAVVVLGDDPLVGEVGRLDPGLDRDRLRRQPGASATRT